MSCQLLDIGCTEDQLSYSPENPTRALNPTPYSITEMSDYAPVATLLACFHFERGLKIKLTSGSEPSKRGKGEDEKEERVGG